MDVPLSGKRMPRTRFRLLVATGLACLVPGGSTVGDLAALGATGPAARVSFTTGSGPVAVAVGDLNGDRRIDLATANLYGNTVSVLLHRANGSFVLSGGYPAGGDPRSVAIGDLNGDGRKDVVTSSSDANIVSVLLNRGGGRLTRRRDYPTHPGPLAVDLGDVNGDRRSDVVTANRTATVSVLTNDGKASLKRRRSYRTGPEPVSVKVGDLNADGRRDLVTANFGSSTVSVLINRGSRGFGPKQDFRTGLRPMAVAIGDLNGDHRPDLTTANLEAGTVSVLLNAGGGSFRRRHDYRAGTDPRSVAIGDVNGDRRRDVIAANAEAGEVSTLLNQGSGRLEAPRRSATGRYPVSVAMGDFDGDGRRDAVTANLAASKVSVLRARDLAGGNASPTPEPAPAPPVPGLLLWNELGNTSEVTHSAYGPELTLYDCRDRTAPHFGRRCTIDVAGTLSYPSGVAGGAATIGSGRYFPEARIHTAVLRKSILNPEHGAVEAWYRQESDPVPREHNPHRIFGGPYSLTGIDEVNLYVQDRLDSGDPRLHFEVFFGVEPPPFVPAQTVSARSLDDGALGYRISSLNGRWIHVAGVWDRRGIAGSTDTVRLYVNGEVVAAAKTSSWGTTPCGRRVSARPAGACFNDVAGCNDTCAGRFAVDEVKAWNYARTEYGSRMDRIRYEHLKEEADAYRIVLASDRDGVNRGYSLLSDGSRLAPLLPRGRQLVPMAVSANGRTIAYMKLGIDPDPTGAVYVSRGSGAGFRLAARSGYAPALSRDGRLLAYTSKSLWIVATNGHGRRRLGRCSLCATLDWAPGGKALVFDEWHPRDVGTWYDVVVQPLHGKRRRLVRVHTEDAEGGFPSWSPSGRWIAYVDDGDDRPRGLWIVRPNGSRLHRVAAGWGFSYAWSPDGRRLAFVRGSVTSRVSIVDPAGHEKRLGLSVDVSAVAWSPDGRELLLAARRGSDAEQIWTVRTDGRGLRRLTSGGSNTLLGTTRMPPVLPAAAPIPPSERVASARTVETTAPIADLSADGQRVAFLVGKTATDCHHATVWTPGTTAVERFALQAPCWFPWDALTEVELAGSRAAWVGYTKHGGYPGGEYALMSASLAEPTPRMLSVRGLERGQVWDYHLRGHGDFLLFNDGPRLVRVGVGKERCDGGVAVTSLCATLKRGTHATAVDSVSGGLIAIREPDAVAVLDQQGNVVRLFPFAPGGVEAARLDGGRLVVWRFGALEAYDVGTGAIEASRPAPAGYRLVDADGGVAVLVRDDTLLLVRLADGASRTFAPGGPVVAELEPAGLYYAHRLGNGGRLVFVPRSEVFS